MRNNELLTAIVRLQFSFELQFVPSYPTLQHLFFIVMIIDAKLDFAHPSVQQKWFFVASLHLVRFELLNYNALENAVRLSNHVASR